ncbi:MAG: hypothetical protein IPO83_14675 [Chitinophagaceae bacterium]|nr:hypothetical protein [Chitinophagaceae bacterium]
MKSETEVKAGKYFRDLNMDGLHLNLILPILPSSKKSFTTAEWIPS